MSQPLAKTIRDSLTERQRNFVVSYVLNGGKQSLAAKEAGYENPRQESWRLLQLPHVKAAIRAEQERQIDCELASMSIGALKDALQIPDVPWNVKVKAAQIGLALAGFGVKPGDKQGEKSLIELDPAQLASLIAETERKITHAKTRESAIDAELVGEEVPENMESDTA